MVHPLQSSNFVTLETCKIEIFPFQLNTIESSNATENKDVISEFACPVFICAALVYIKRSLIDLLFKIMLLLRQLKTQILHD